MADIKSCLLDFETASGSTTGPIVVSGVNDARTGVPFSGRVFIFFTAGHDGFIDFGPTEQNQFMWQFWGLDDGTTAYAGGFEQQWSSNVGWQSLFGDIANSAINGVAVFSPSLTVRGKITAIASGQFTLTTTVNQFGPTQYSVLVLGGSDLRFKVGKIDLSNGTHSVTGVGFRPAGMFRFGASTTTSSGGGNTWGGGANLGFVDSDLTQVACGIGGEEGLEPATTYSYQRTGFAGVSVDSTGTAVDYLTIDSWDADGFTYTFDNAGTAHQFYLLVGGCLTKAGSFTQPVADGSFLLSVPGILPVAMLTASVNKPADTSVQSDALMTFGATDGSAQSASWVGEKSGADRTQNGGQMWGGSQSHFFAMPDGVESSDSIIQGQLSVSGFLSQTVHGGWSDCDGTEREVLYFVIGGEPVVPTGTVYSTRRLRQFALPVSEDNKWLFLRKLELLMQTGMGLSTGQGSDPQVMVQISRDYGNTWSPERWVSAGLRGQYDRRVILRNLGRMRSGGYVRIVVSDPVQWTFLAALADLEEGTS